MNTIAQYKLTLNESIDSVSCVVSVLYISTIIEFPLVVKAVCNDLEKSVLIASIIVVSTKVLQHKNIYTLPQLLELL